MDPAAFPAGELAALYHQRWESEMVFTQLAKRAVRPLGGGREHVADLDLVAGDDHPVDEQFGQQPPLAEGSGGQAGQDGLAECLGLRVWRRVPSQAAASARVTRWPRASSLAIRRRVSRSGSRRRVK